VKRDSPRPRSHRAAPSFPVPASHVFGRAGRRAKRDVRVDEHGASRLRDESAPSHDRRKASPDGRCAGKRRSTSARVGTVSECRSRSDASPVATPAGRYQAHRGTARPSPEESFAPRLTRGRATRSSDNGARALEASSNHEEADELRPHAQASAGSHPEGCGLGDSGSPRATSARFPIRRKGVRVENTPP